MTSTKQSPYPTKEFGVRNDESYRIFYTNKDGHIISPFHDIPLYANEDKKIFNMVVEIPRWTNAKMEISKSDPMNPIKQDIKKGKLRFVNNVFPYHGYIWNYGALPQTWENPCIPDTDTNTKGDNDPIDVVEIGDVIAERGEVKQVKVLGVLAMIDEGEMDWKVVCIDVNDPKAERLNDVEDVEREMPGLLAATRDWFRSYKPGVTNDFAFEGHWKDKEFALKTIAKTNEEWKSLVHGKCGEAKVNIMNVSVEGSPDNVKGCDTAKVVEGMCECSGSGNPVPQSVDSQLFIKRGEEEKIILKA